MSSEHLGCCACALHVEQAAISSFEGKALLARPTYGIPHEAETKQQQSQ